MQHREYIAFKLSQRGQGNATDFAIFLCNAKDIDQWAGIKRVGENENGTQRILKDTRVKAINRFITSNTRNTIPVGVILAFNPGTANFRTLTQKIDGCINQNLNYLDGKGEIGVVEFDFDENVLQHERPALIVDGQHRVKGLASVDEDIPILVVALLNAPPQEQAFQFVVINNKTQKVPTDNVKAIIRLIDGQEAELMERLQQIGVNYGSVSATLGDINELAESPFRGILKWALNPDNTGFIELSTIESSLRYIKTQLPILKEDDESVKDIFMAMWRATKRHYPELWSNTREELAEPAKNKFMSKVNINALNEFLTDKVGNAWLDDKFDLFNMDQVEQYCYEIALRQIPQEFWLSEWTYRLQDNAVVRNRIKEDLVRITQNMKSDKEWYDGLTLTSQV